MLINVLSHHQHHFDVWYYRKMRMICKKIYAKILFCISYLRILYDKFLWAIWRGIRKMRTTKLAHERADEGLETKPTLSTWPSLALTLILTSHPHTHSQFVPSSTRSCATFRIPFEENKKLGFIERNFSLLFIFSLFLKIKNSFIFYKIKINIFFLYFINI